jgi:AcrR family transcriptional regulator
VSSIPVSNIAELLASPGRRERNGEATRKRILDAAEREFAAKGFDGARLAAIAHAADAPQALIHHYFADKAGLYREVLERSLAAIAQVSWHILDTLGPPKKRGKAGKSKRFGRVELQALVDALVGMLVGFYATHARVLRILRHEAMRGGPLASELVRAHVKPQLDDVVARFEEMRASGEVRADIDARHLCISTVAMACFPYTEEAFLEAVWSLDPQSPEFVEERKREIVRTVLARITP